MTYHLRDGLSFCVCADRMVFLDLRADRYFCLGAALEACFKRWAGAPAVCHGPEHIAPLCRDGLLVCGDDRPPTGHLASAPAVAKDVDAGSPARLRDVAEALVAQMMATARLRYRPLARVVEHCRTLEHESAAHIEWPRSGGSLPDHVFRRSGG